MTLQTLVLIVSFVCTPLLLLMALREWYGGLVPVFANWRNVIAATSLMLIFLSWALPMALFVSALLIKPQAGSLRVYFLSKILAIAGFILSVALSRTARLEALSAGFLMMLWGPTGYVSLPYRFPPTLNYGANGAGLNSEGRTTQGLGYDSECAVLDFRKANELRKHFPMPRMWASSAFADIGRIRERDCQR